MPIEQGVMNRLISRLLPSGRNAYKIKRAHEIGRYWQQNNKKAAITGTPFEGAIIGDSAYIERFSPLPVPLQELIKRAISSAVEQKDTTFFFVDIFSGDPAAARQIMLGKTVSIGQIPPTLHVAIRAIGLTDERRDEDKRRDSELDVKVLERILVTPNEFRDALQESLQQQGDNNTSLRSANVVFFSPLGHAADIPDIPEIMKGNLNEIYNRLSYNNGVFVMEFSYAANYHYLKRVRRKLRKWAQENHPGIKVYFNQKHPEMIAIVKTPAAPEHLPDW